MARMFYSNLLHDVQVKQDRELGTTSVLVDGKPVEHVKRIEFHQSAIEIPRITFEINALPEVETQALVEFDFTPESYTDAAKLLIAGAKADSPLRNGLFHSIMSAIDDMDDEAVKRRRMTIAEAVTKRLLNED